MRDEEGEKERKTECKWTEETWRGKGGYSVIQSNKKQEKERWTGKVRRKAGQNEDGGGRYTRDQRCGGGK